MAGTIVLAITSCEQKAKKSDFEYQGDMYRVQDLQQRLPNWSAMGHVCLANLYPEQRAEHFTGYG